MSSADLGSAHTCAQSVLSSNIAVCSAFVRIHPAACLYTLAMLSLFNPAMATLSGTLSFFMPGIFGILGILGILGAAGMLLNQVAGWLVLAGVA